MTAWRKSSFSMGTGNCAEVMFLPDGNVAIRHSNHDGPAQVYTAGEWDAFLAGVHNHEFARPAAGDDEERRADTDCACPGGDECPCDADGPDGLCPCCRNGDHRGSCAVDGYPVAGRGAADGGDHDG